MKIGDHVWYNLLSTNTKSLGRILSINPHRMDGSNVIIAAGISEIWRLPHEITVATDEEVVLWKLENL